MSGIRVRNRVRSLAPFAGTWACGHNGTRASETGAAGRRRPARDGRRTSLSEVLLCAGLQVFPCRAVIFDKDGTLFDAYRFLAALHRMREQVVAQAAGHDVLPLYRRLCGVAYQPVRKPRWIAASGGLWLDSRGPLYEAAFDEEAAILAAVLAAEGRPWSEARSAARQLLLEADRRLAIPDITHPLPGVVAAVSRLADAGLRLALATGDTESRARAQLAFTGLDRRFGAVVTPERTGRGKPAPEFVWEACRDLGVAPEECVVVGDSPVDCEMGRAAGVRGTIGVGPEARDAAPWTAWLPSVAELEVQNA